MYTLRLGHLVIDDAGLRKELNKQLLLVGTQSVGLVLMHDDMKHDYSCFH